MSIDERLEALTQTVELLAGMHKDLIEAQKNTDRMLVQVMEGLGKLV